MKISPNDDKENAYISEENARATARLIIATVIATGTGGFHFGFQLSYINPTQEILKSFVLENLERRYGLDVQSNGSFIWSFTVGCLLLGASFGAMVMSLVKKGPRAGLLISAKILLLSTLLSAISAPLDMAELFIIGRLLSGVGVGMGTSAQGIFLTECSPVHLRGFIGSFGGFAATVGFILAAAIGVPIIWQAKNYWTLIFYFEGFLCMAWLIMIPIFVKESPMYLMRVGKTEQAFNALQGYSGMYAKHDLNRIEKELKGTGINKGLLDILNDRVSRNALFLSSALNGAVAFSGIVAMSFFGTHLFAQFGFSPHIAAIANLLASLTGPAGNVFAVMFTDRIGRRFLVIGGILILATSDTVFMLVIIVYEAYQISWLVYIFLIVFMFFSFVFGASIGPTSWFLGAELSSSDSRATIQSISVGIQHIACFLTPLIFYPLNSTLGPLSFLTFIIPLIITALVFYRYLPETKGKSTEEIQKLLM